MVLFAVGIADIQNFTLINCTVFPTRSIRNLSLEGATSVAVFVLAMLPELGSLAFGIPSRIASEGSFPPWFLLEITSEPRISVRQRRGIDDPESFAARYGTNVRASSNCGDTTHPFMFARF